ncbi:uncharacterized protein [Primulina eburnea]|uniref:uncharacterized protein isoform X3 n=1 Tax=Primulina eburnea TaxID=1245227 RepID=UPI003C6C56E5
MLSAITLPILDGVVVLSARHLSSSKSLHPPMVRWGLKREQDIRLHPRSSRAILVLANPNVCTNQGFCMYNAQFNGLNMLKALFRYLQAKEIQTK